MKAAGIFLAAVLAGSAMAQTAAVLSPPTLSPLFGVNGLPLAAGQLFTCVAGSSCPGTPQASYTDSGAGTMNQNPVVLNAAGMAPVWLLNLPYKLVLKTSAGVTVATVDNWLPGGFSTTGPWSTSGTTIFNAASGTRVCISSTPCTTALAELNVQGTSSGTAYLIRIDDAGNSPGLNLFGSGNAMGSYAADSAGLRLRAADGSSQMTVAAGNVTLQDARSSGATVFTLKAGAAQGSANLLQAQNNSGTNLGYIDSAGRFVSPLFNSTATGTDIGFQTANSAFSVNGSGDITGAGGINMTGANGNAPYKVNGVTMVDASGNATFTTLTCTGSPCGSGGGGGSFPVSDATTLFYNASTTTKTGKFDLSALTAATTRTLAWPDANITIMGRENAETVSGAKTFSAVVTGNAGFTGTVFNATNTGGSITFQNANSNFSINGSGDISAVGNTVITGYISSLTWIGLKKETATPGTAPGGGNSAFTYKGGTSGLEVWIYDTVHSAWSSVDLGVAGTGISSINGQTGAAQTIAGTANRVTATTTANTVTLSAPQDIATTSNVNFATVTTTGVMQSSATGASLTFKNSNNLFSVDGNGNISSAGQLNLAGGGAANLFKIGGTTVIDNNRNATVVNLTITGTCTGCASSGVSSAAGTSNQVLVNGGTGAQSGAITLSLPQSIGTSSTPTFGGVVASGAFNSAATGSSRAFQTSGTTFIVNGDGNVSTVADVNLNSTGGTGTLKVAGNIVINSSGQFVGANGISTSGGGTFGSGVTFNGGLTTNFSTNSILYIGTGSLYLRTFSGGDASCGGVTNGWVGIRTDTDEIQVCIGGAVKKASLF